MEAKEGVWGLQSWEGEELGRWEIRIKRMQGEIRCKRRIRGKR